MKFATVGDLADQILDKSRSSEFLYNVETGERYSASKGDYWDLPDDHVFENCILATEEITIRSV